MWRAVGALTKGQCEILSAAVDVVVDLEKVGTSLRGGLVIDTGSIRLEWEQ
jgi:hypothetical protein